MVSDCVIKSVMRNGFYGWPYSYFRQILDPRMEGEAKDLIEQAIIPDISVDNHTPSLGLAFYKSHHFLGKQRNRAFVDLDGSRNRDKLSGLKVLFIPFENGKADRCA